MLLSRSGPQPFAERLADILGARVVARGSAGAKTAEVLLGAADLYVHAGGRPPPPSFPATATIACDYRRTAPGLPGMRVGPRTGPFGRVAPRWFAAMVETYGREEHKRMGAASRIAESPPSAFGATEKGRPVWLRYPASSVA